MPTPGPILLPDGSELRFPAWRFWRVSLRWTRPARLPFVHGAVLRDFLAEIAGGRVSRSWLPRPLENGRVAYQPDNLSKKDC